MDRRTSPAQAPAPGDLSINSGSSPQPCPGAKTAAGPVMSLGEGLPTTVRHFWPEFNQWLDGVPDTRFPPLVVYHRRFLIWWGISLYLFQLGSRRQLDIAGTSRTKDSIAKRTAASTWNMFSAPTRKGSKPTISYCRSLTSSRKSWKRAACFATSRLSTDRRLGGCSAA